MGGCSTAMCTDDGEALTLHREAQKVINTSKKEKVIVCLLLGTGDSGKSTVVKQMQILHKNGFSDHEKKFYSPVIRMNIFESLRIVLSEISARGLNFSKSELREYAAQLLQMYDSATIIEEFPPDVNLKIQSIIQDELCQKFVKEPDGFYLPASTEYFFQEFPRISQTDWVPNNDDILRCRKPTHGVHEIDFEIKQSTAIVRMVDVGGQKTERRKWIHFFEGTKTIIFCASLIDYDLTLMEDPSRNRMLDSLEVFEAIINSRWFMRSTVVLFMNKLDLFCHKVSRIPLTVTFPEYTDENNYKAAVPFLCKLYKMKNKTNIKIFPHITTATDCKTFKAVMNAVIVSIVDANQPYKA